MNRLISCSLILTFVFSNSIYAESKALDCDEKTDTEKTAAKLVAVAKMKRNCPNIEALNGGICDDLRMKRKIKGTNNYAYRKIIQEASCVDPDNDDEDTQKAKIQKFWSTYEDQLICDANDFNVQRGNIIKFAVSKRFENFIDDVIEWGVNLNKIDTLDKRTVLDYVEYEIKRNKGNALEEELKGYRDSLREAGAKYARELE